MTFISNNIEQAAALLKQHLIVAVPTETVYGLAANAFSEVAIQRVFEAKNRPTDHPLIVHIGHFDELFEWASVVPNLAVDLAMRFWPGPLTLVLPKQPHVSSKITGGLNTVAIRMPNHPLLVELLHSIDFPLVAPSANSFTQISPTAAKHVYRSLSGKIPMILDGGDCSIGIESTIVAFDQERPIILRQGAIPMEEIESIAGDVKVNTTQTSVLRAPGMHDVHYAPRKRCFHVHQLDSSKLHPNLKTGIITLKPIHTQSEMIVPYSLSDDGDLITATRLFYHVLHELDQLEIDCIVIELMPDEFEGRSLNDRIRRASQPFPL